MLAYASSDPRRSSGVSPRTASSEGGSHGTRQRLVQSLILTNDALTAEIDGEPPPPGLAQIVPDTHVAQESFQAARKGLGVLGGNQPAVLAVRD